MKEPIPLHDLPGEHAPKYRAASQGSSDEEGGRKPGLFRRAYRGARWLSAAPVDWFGAAHLRRGMSVIGYLASRMRAPSRRDQRFKIEPNGHFDLQATAFLHGLSVGELEARLSSRRRQTAFLAYAAFGLGCFFLLAWVRHALGAEMTASRLALAVYFLPFCAPFFLIAFYNALLNFQIRARRTVGWREYLWTEAGFLPR